MLMKEPCLHWLQRSVRVKTNPCLCMIQTKVSFSVESQSIVNWCLLKNSRLLQCSIYPGFHPGCFGIDFVLRLFCQTSPCASRTKFCVRMASASTKRGPATVTMTVETRVTRSIVVSTRSQALMHCKPLQHISLHVYKSPTHLYAVRHFSLSSK